MLEGCRHIKAAECWFVDANTEDQLPTAPFSALRHCTPYLALRPVQFEPARGRGIDAGGSRTKPSDAGPSSSHHLLRTLRRRPPQPSDVWHLDEVVEKIAGRSYWLWRAVDQYWVVLEEILQPKRDRRPAKRLLVRLMNRWSFVAKRIITTNYAATELPGVKPRLVLIIGPTAGSIIGLRTVICRFENESGLCEASYRQVGCNSMPQPTITSPSPPAAVPPSQSVTTAWRHSTLGNLRLRSPDVRPARHCPD